jgi:hypothetical protein
MLNVASEKGGALPIFREAICNHVLSRPSSLEASNSGRDDSSVVGFLKQTIENRLGIKDIPDGYSSFLVELGGLEVQSQFTPFLIAPVPCLMSLRKQRKHTNLPRSRSSAARRMSCTTSWMIPSSNLANLIP